MANKKDNTKRYDVEHLRNLARYRAQVDAIYRELVKEAAAIAVGVAPDFIGDAVDRAVGTAPEDMFLFANYPKTMKRVNALIAAYRADMQKVIVNGVKSEWTLANNKNNELARQVFGDKAGKLTAEQERRYYKNNDTARDAFLGRKERGLSLSDRVWDYSGKLKNEIEMGIDLCLRKGMPAAEMARELQKYLKHPDELFRRVRDEHGMLKLSQAAKDYHPGRGVYRSSYKNALRLAITETNMAYRLADWERWQQMDFVVGIRIQLSNNHTCLGADGNPHPFYDICDELAGDYPKTFKWTGWHPQCRCNAVPILKTVDEKIADNMDKRNGQAPAKESVNSVKKMPKVFTDWLKGNKNRIATAKSQPYFIRDNAAAVSKIIPGVLPEDMIPATPLPIAERAKMRHDARTTDEKRINEMMRQMNTDEFNLTVLERYYIAKNNLEIEKILGVTKEKPMSVDEADKQNANPNYVPEFIIDPNGKFWDGHNRMSRNPKYNKQRDIPNHNNCQTCTPAYLLRLRGFNFTAKPCIQGSKSEYLAKGSNAWKVWKNIDGTSASHISINEWLNKKGYMQMSPKRYLEFFNEICKDPGVYELSIGWKQGYGHATILQRFKDGTLRYIEPQSDNSTGSGYEWKNIEYLANRGAYKMHSCRGIMRIDNKLFNSDFIDIFN